MKKLLRVLLVLVAMGPLAGCELFSTDDDKTVTFVNNSTTTVNVRPAGYSKYWGAFSFQPGERVTVSAEEEVFFAYEPRWRVEVGANEKALVTFIDITPNTETAE